MKTQGELRKKAFTDKTDFRLCLERADLEDLRTAARIFDTSAAEIVRELIRAYLETRRTQLASARADMAKRARRTEPPTSAT